MIYRIFLGLTGLLYLVFSLWCVVRDTQTARAVGFEFANNSGRSEYMTVYGGLQLGLALLYLWAAWQGVYLREGLALAAVTHGTIVLFRAASLFMFSGLQPMTYAFFGLELVFMVVAVVLLMRYEAA